MDQERKKKLFWYAGAAIVTAGIVGWLLTATPVQAADLGGNCCADLEDRIAELEATAAKKGNRKVTLTVYGQVNTALQYVDVGDYSDTTVIQNGTDESRIGFAGQGRINPDLIAGYVLEIDLRQLGLLGAPIDSTQPDVRQQYAYIRSASIGQLSIGLQAQATQDFDKITTANTTAVQKPLSFGGLSDSLLTGIDVPFDGAYRNSVRYDSPAMSGFVVSASWGDSVDINDPNGNGDTYDIALKYKGGFSDFKVEGAAGWRRSTDLEINLLNIVNVSVPTGDVDTLLAVGSVMHETSGLFLTANYADQDWKDFDFKLKGWQATGGLEQRWFAVGKTTLYGEYGRITFDPDSGDSADIDLWGLGVVQALDGAAMDVYVGYRVYQLDDLGLDDDISTATAGARIQF